MSVNKGERTMKKGSPEAFAAAKKAVETRKKNRTKTQTLTIIVPVVPVMDCGHVDDQEHLDMIIELLKEIRQDDESVVEALGRCVATYVEINEIFNKDISQRTG
jgi:hypothetical protein